MAVAAGRRDAAQIHAVHAGFVRHGRRGRRAARRGVVRIGKIRNGPFLILPRSTTAAAAAPVRRDRLAVRRLSSEHGRRSPCRGRMGGFPREAGLCFVPSRYSSKRTGRSGC